MQQLEKPAIADIDQEVRIPVDDGGYHGIIFRVRGEAERPMTSGPDPKPDGEWGPGSLEGEPIGVWVTGGDHIWTDEQRRAYTSIPCVWVPFIEYEEQAIAEVVQGLNEKEFWDE